MSKRNKLCFKAILLSIISVVLMSCQTLSTVRHVSEIGLRHYKLGSDTKDVRFLGIHHFGKEKYYENAAQYLKEASDAGYTVFYEDVRWDDDSEEVILKFRKMIGDLSDSESYAAISGKLSFAGIISYDNLELLRPVEGSLEWADVTAGDLVRQYERIYGPIELDEADLNTPLAEPVSNTVPRSTVSRVLVDYRNEQLADKIVSSDKDSILVLYGEKHFGGLVAELQKRDSTFQIDKIRHVRGDNSLLNRPIHGVYPVTEQDGYIENVKNSMGLMLSQNTNLDQFNVNFPGGRFDLRQNAASSTNITAFADGLRFSYGRVFDFMPGNNDDGSKGNTSSNKFELEGFTDRWHAHYSYTRVNGFYLANSADYLPQASDEEFITFPNLKYRSHLISAGYIVNPRFSLGAISNFTERQLISTGTFLPSLTVQQFTTDETSSLSEVTTSQKSTNLRSQVNFGYYYNLVPANNWLLSLHLAPGIGYQNTDLTTRTQNGNMETGDNNVVYSLTGGMAMLYTSRFLFTGAKANVDFSEYSQESGIVNVSQSTFFVSLFIGYRFGGFSL